MTDDSWIDDLFLWANDNKIPDLQYIEGNTQIGEGFWVGLPRDKEVLINLEDLNLCWHDCCEIPKQIRYLKNLKKFCFSKSRDGLKPPYSENLTGLGGIEEIPDWISELEYLEELDLSNNKIRYVPNAIGRLNNLKKLYLHDNLIMFVDTDLFSLYKLEVLWIKWNRLSVLDYCIANLKGASNFDIDWKQQNKLSVLKDCLNHDGFQKWIDETYLGVNMRTIDAVTNGIAYLMDLIDSTDIEVLWREWSKMNNFKYKLKKLKNLRELYCDGLEYPSGPIKLCPDGLIVASETLQKSENCVEVLLDNIPTGFLVKSDSFDMKIELKEFHGKSLIEKIDLMGLWKY